MSSKEINWALTATDRTAAAFASIDRKVGKLTAGLESVSRVGKVLGSIAGVGSVAALAKQIYDVADSSGQLDKSTKDALTSVQNSFKVAAGDITRVFAPALEAVANSAALRIPQAFAALDFAIVASRQKLVEFAAATADFFGDDDLAAQLRDQARLLTAEIDKAGRELDRRLAGIIPQVSNGTAAAPANAASASPSRAGGTSQLTRELRDAQAEEAQFLKDMAEITKKSNSYFQDLGAGIMEKFRDPLDVLTEQLADLNAAFLAGTVTREVADRAAFAWGTNYADSVAKVTVANQDLEDSTNGLLRDLKISTDGFARDLTDAFFDSTQSIGDMFEQLAVTIAKTLFTQSITEPLVKGLLGSLGGASGLGSLFGGARAAGGPVAAGKAYLVGERGPELFMPGGSGRIIPNGDAGMAPISVNLTITSVDPQTAAQTIAGNERLITGMVRRAMERAGYRPRLA